MKTSNLTPNQVATIIYYWNQNCYPSDQSVWKYIDALKDQYGINRKFGFGFGHDKTVSDFLYCWKKGKDYPANDSLTLKEFKIWLRQFLNID